MAKDLTPAELEAKKLRRRARRAARKARAAASPTPVAVDITPASLDLFIRYAKDAGNWSGEPLIGADGNVSKDEKAERGNLTQLKKAGLITVNVYPGGRGSKKCRAIVFTEAGRAFAKGYGITLLA